MKIGTISKTTFRGWKVMCAVKAEAADFVPAEDNPEMLRLTLPRHEDEDEDEECDNETIDAISFFWSLNGKTVTVPYFLDDRTISISKWALPLFDALFVTFRLTGTINDD